MLHGGTQPIPSVPALIETFSRSHIPEYSVNESANVVTWHSIVFLCTGSLLFLSNVHLALFCLIMVSPKGLH